MMGKVIPLLRTIILLFVVVVGTPVCSLDNKPAVVSKLSSYTAAVYEHSPILPTLGKSYTRQQAVKLMKENLDVYGQATREAGQLGAQIVVFPEDGIYGFILRKRELIRPFLETIPDAKVTRWSPCMDPTRYQDTQVQHTLSCMAKENGLFVVANMGDLVPCNVTQDPHCPPDGAYHYNTDVAYDPQGFLLAKYHKVNLYFEPQFDKPEPEVAYFDTPFGRFGMLVCFDLLFKSPAVSMLAEHGIANIAFPTAWMDALPMLSAVGYHSSFARGNGVNFLAANIHLPAQRFQGSGIYTPDGVVDFYYNNDHFSRGRLIVSTVKVLQQNAHAKDRVVTDKKIANHLNSVGQEFHSSLLHDEYTFQLLEKPSGKLQVCHTKLCCYLNYTRSGNDTNELFALGAFDGLHTHNGQYYLQTCALVKCGNNKDKMSCGHYTYDSSTEFSYVSLTGTFETDHVYPQVITVKDRQLIPGGQSSWGFEDNTVTSRAGLQDPLLAAILLGRYYDRDQGWNDQGSLARPSFVMTLISLVLTLVAALR